jgi:hypothetical protein
MPELMGTAEISNLLNVSRQRVSQLVKQAGFPEPHAKLIGGWIWLREDVERWARETGRLSE